MKSCLKCLHPVDSMEDDYCLSCLIDMGRVAADIQKDFDGLIAERDEYYRAYTGVRDGIADAKESLNEILLYANKNHELPRHMVEDIVKLAELVDKLDWDIR